jgi:hypothetical protein
MRASSIGCIREYDSAKRKGVTEWNEEMEWNGVPVSKSCITRETAG